MGTMGTSDEGEGEVEADGDRVIGGVERFGI